MSSNSNNLKGFICFPTQGHTGHTIIAAILASHPNIAITNTYSTSISIRRILEEIKIERWDRRYDFYLDNQDNYENLKYVGFSGAKPGEQITLPLKPILVLRNPFDVIGSRYVKFKNRKEEPMKYAITNYCTRMAEAFKQNFFTVIHEKFIDSPRCEIDRILEYLDLQAPSEEWVMNYLRIVSPVVMPSRQHGMWDSESVDKIKRFLDKHKEGYRLWETNYDKTKI